MASLLDSVMRQYWQTCFSVVEDDDDIQIDEAFPDSPLRLSGSAPGGFTRSPSGTYGLAAPVQDTPLAGLAPCGFTRSTSDPEPGLELVLPATDRSALRLVLCEQAFLQLAGIHNDCIDKRQHKIGLVFVFKQLTDVPVPEDDWFDQVFANFDIEGAGRLHFERFVEIVRQWDEFCHERRRHLSELTAAAHAVAAETPSVCSSLSSSSGRLARPQLSAFPFALFANQPFSPGGRGGPGSFASGGATSSTSLAGGLENFKLEVVEEGEDEGFAEGEPAQPLPQMEKRRGRRRFPSSGRWQPAQREKKERSRSNEKSSENPVDKKERSRSNEKGSEKENEKNSENPVEPRCRSDSPANDSRKRSESPVAKGLRKRSESPNSRKRSESPASDKENKKGSHTGGPRPTGRSRSGRWWSISTPSARSRSESPSRSTAADIAPEVRVPTHIGQHAVVQNYEFLSPLGEGACGKVVKVCHKLTRQIRACKVVDFSGPAEKERVDTEIALLKLLNHPNIMKLHEVYFDQDPALCESVGNVYLVTELCHGGDLLWRMALHQVRIKCLMKEIYVAYIMRQILSAIRYCHGLGIMHRDIKPANILFMGNSPTSPVKVIDFGFAAFTQRIRQTAREKNVPRSGTLGRLAQILPTVGGKELLAREVRRHDMQTVGTAYYMAPELIAGSYDEKADLFSLGVVLCELLTGAHPFYTPRVDDELSVKANIIAREAVEFPSAILPGEEASRHARDLCLALLQKSPRQRLSARQALGHRWFKDPSQPTPHGNIDVLNASIFDALVKYKSDNKLKRAVFQFISSEISEGEIQELCGKFMALDADGDGLLSAEGLAEAARRVGHELPLEELRQIVAALDTSGQGRIGYKEFAAALCVVEGGLGLDQFRLQECFRKFDGSGAGHISYEDVNKVLCTGDGATPGITPSEWEEIVNPSSTDLNGHHREEARDGSGKSSIELTLEAFMTLMLSQDGETEKEDASKRTTPNLGPLLLPEDPEFWHWQDPESDCPSELGDLADETISKVSKTLNRQASDNSLGPITESESTEVPLHRLQGGAPRPHAVQPLGAEVEEWRPVGKEERSAVERLAALGFEPQTAAKAYFVCDENEELAATFLFEEQAYNKATVQCRSAQVHHEEQV